jgi:hypothetical protein
MDRQETDGVRAPLDGLGTWRRSPPRAAGTAATETDPAREVGRLHSAVGAQQRTSDPRARSGVEGISSGAGPPAFLRRHGPATEDGRYASTSSSTWSLTSKFA